MIHTNTQTQFQKSVRVSSRTRRIVIGSQLEHPRDQTTKAYPPETTLFEVTTMRTTSTSSNDNNTTVVVFGSTGAVGASLIGILSENQPNWNILAVSRNVTTKKFSHLPNVKVVNGDATSRDDVMKLCANADIVYSCIGFPKYERKYWAKHWPIVVDNLLEASSQHDGQKFVFCDNLYAYGATTNMSPSTRTTSPTTVQASLKSKPSIRASLWTKFEQRMSTKPQYPISIVGGSDFFGPGVTNTSFLGDTFTKNILTGKERPIAIGSCTKIHDFCYVVDFAHAMYIASVDDKANNKFWICPHAIQNKSLTDIANDISKLSTQSDSSKPKHQARIQTFPGWSIRLLSPFVGFMGEMVEMLPNWTNDYSVVANADNEFCKTFGAEATSYDDALKAYIKFYENEMEQEQAQK